MNLSSSRWGDRCEDSDKEIVKSDNVMVVYETDDEGNREAAVHSFQGVKDHTEEELRVFSTKRPSCEGHYSLWGWIIGAYRGANAEEKAVLGMVKSGVKLVMTVTTMG
ncbi:hypothetical protein F0562_014774 [Nyssa sinensis]|uniref:Uncharacterized protein n=1 Tax=Nyssa sinensis TaxID=561372 RepID=A0A5J4ZS19_9ASTE|nr:hypothetical protein F0562_014774 [Nyssa sinensis]